MVRGDDEQSSQSVDHRVSFSLLPGELLDSKVKGEKTVNGSVALYRAKSGRAGSWNPQRLRRSLGTGLSNEAKTWIIPRRVIEIRISNVTQGDIR